MPSRPEVIKERRKNDPEYAARLKSYAEKYREANRDKERDRQRHKAAEKRSSSREAYNSYMREWREQNKDRINSENRDRRLTDTEYAERIRALDRQRYANDPDAHRSIRLKSVYGITLDDYRSMYQEQEGKCAICGTSCPDHGKMGLVVDHCHKNGHVRKLLCTHCNKGIGQFKEDPEILQKAIEYLKERGQS